MKKLAVLLFLLGFIAKSPACSAACITKIMSVCKVAGTETRDADSGENEGMAVTEAGDESDELKLPVYPYAFALQLCPVSVLPVCTYLQQQVPYHYHAVTTPPPRC